MTAAEKDLIKDTTGKYVLGIETVHDGDTGKTIGYFSKGHHSKASFMRHAREDWDIKMKRADVHHDWWRSIVRKQSPDWTSFIPGEKGKQGSYPVTVYWLK